jgi:hypothetical protein
MTPLDRTAARFTQDTRQETRFVAVPLAVVQLGTSATTIYTAPDDEDFLLKALWIANVTGTGRTATLYNVPASGSAAAGNAMMAGAIVTANSGPWKVIEGLLIPRGGSLQGLADAATAVNVWGWGAIYSGGPLP